MWVRVNVRVEISWYTRSSIGALSGDIKLEPAGLHDSGHKPLRQCNLIEMNVFVSNIFLIRCTCMSQGQCII